jgi:hypothetical protein
MKRFSLETKHGERISYVSAHTIEEAKEMFSKIKRLPLIELTKIFNIKEV